ncbi:hypothetical protein Bca52824_095628 [Brassica carinata]|uniref:3,4-dihydroxy-2-butanone kinase n=1 Tax=Brassica carinata TaxID=52824 RepID=A0A8X7P1C7_BRACI|nr:hypothetical protein Bca52824_095628 [Brassica carinata]
MVYAAKKFINNPNDVVTEFIEGLVETYPGLQYLDGFPEVKVVLRADVSAEKYDKVAVISGGGSGHEPAHAGYVGEGMLTAAICGDVFASPPVDSILAGIRAVTGPQGCLLIVKNYTGDRLNFGLAAEQAKSEGYKVESVKGQNDRIFFVDCNCWRGLRFTPPRGIAGRRGLAGTVLVHKVAGAAAAAGLSLEKLRPRQSVRRRWLVTSDRLGQEKMELGLGIHGEPGAAVVDVQPVEVVVSHVLQQILSPETNYVPITRLGGTPLMELMIAAGKAVPKLQLEFGLAVDRVYTGLFMTSPIWQLHTPVVMLTVFSFLGFSISIMKADQPILDRLDAPTKAPNWPVGTDGPQPPPAKIPVPIPPSRSAKSAESQARPKELSKQGRVLEAAIQAAATVIISLKDSLNEWDGKVGDGDCGSTMHRGATAILEDMKHYYPLNDAAETVNEIGASISRAMGGTSGIIYNLLCKAAYAELKANTESEVTPKYWSKALKSSITSVSKYGGATAGYRTMLDALIPASQVLEEKLSAGEDPICAFILSAEAATKGAESTIQMQAQAGRSSYVSAEMLATVPDPGAMAAAGWYSAAARAVKEQYQGSS